MHMCVFSFTITPYLLCCLCQGRVWLRGAQVLVWGRPCKPPHTPFPERAGQAPWAPDRASSFTMVRRTAPSPLLTSYLQKRPPAQLRQ
jgi:hypothetical protein